MGEGRRTEIPVSEAFRCHGARVYMKIHSGKLHVPFCGRFVPNSVSVARYDSLIGEKSLTKCDAQLAESNFHIHSTCSQLLNSSAMASSLSNWGRWISAAAPLKHRSPAFLSPSLLPYASVRLHSPIPLINEYYISPNNRIYLKKTSKRPS